MRKFGEPRPGAADKPLIKEASSEELDELQVNIDKLRQGKFEEEKDISGIIGEMISVIMKIYDIKELEAIRDSLSSGKGLQFITAQEELLANVNDQIKLLLQQAA